VLLEACDELGIEQTETTPELPGDVGKPDFLITLEQASR
jgi:hypothetical protein